MVNDLSLSGFSATAINRMHPGSVCWLTLPGLESLQAEVVWWENNQCGCAFADPANDLVVAWVVNGMPGEPKHQQRQNAINAAIYEDLKLA